MLSSMTGFGRGEAKQDNVHYEVHCKSVNNRFLELGLRLPSALWSKEADAKKVFGRVLSRGKVDVFWKDLGAQEQSKALTADVELAKSYQKAYERMAEGLGLKSDLRADTVARFPDVIGVAKQDLDDEAVAEAHWKVLKQAMEKAVEALQEARRREGGALQKEFDNQLNQALELVAGIEKASESAKAAFQDKMKQRIGRILENLAPDDPRLVMEAGLLADKADIREELVRFRAHVDEFKRLMGEDKPAGKRLDFLAQELLREANTMGSKSPDASLSHQVVALKAVVEKIKEQILNVE